jgi:tetratricopeptide (TPR) repeat protein
MGVRGSYFFPIMRLYFFPLLALAFAAFPDSIPQGASGSRSQPVSAPGAEDRGLSYAKTGDRCRNSGNIDSAIMWYNRALQTDTAALGKRHPSVARDYNNLGLIWSEKGEYDTAIGYYTLALRIDSTIHGQMHHKVANLYNNLGSSWSAKGEYDKAILYYGLAIEIDTVVLGKNHQNIAICYNNLGLAWDVKGDYKKAIEYFNLAIETALKNPDKLNSEVKTYRINLEQAKRKKQEKAQ